MFNLFYNFWKNKNKDLCMNFFVICFFLWEDKVIFDRKRKEFDIYMEIVYFIFIYNVEVWL